jgi:predicted acyl esterase
MSHTNPTPVLAGQDTDYHIEVRAAHYRFASGHRLRIRIWGGSKDALVQPDATDVTITTGSASTLHVPNFAAAP